MSSISYPCVGHNQSSLQVIDSIGVLVDRLYLIRRSCQAGSGSRGWGAFGFSLAISWYPHFSRLSYKRPLVQSFARLAQLLLFLYSKLFPGGMRGFAPICSTRHYARNFVKVLAKMANNHARRYDANETTS